MLIDRKILIENELDKLKKSAAKLYLDMAISGNVDNTSTAYSDMRARITEMQVDLDLIDGLIKEGHK